MDKLVFLWQEYGKTDSKKLTKGAIKLKSKVRRYVRRAPEFAEGEYCGQELKCKYCGGGWDCERPKGHKGLHRLDEVHEGKNWTKEDTKKLMEEMKEE